MRDFTLTLVALLILTALTLIPRSDATPTQPVTTATPPPSVVRDVPIVSVPALPALPDRVTPALAAPAGRIANPIIGGRASWVRPSLGSRYLAMRFPKGTLVRICGRACVTRVVNDYGPSAKIRPPRIADLSAADFQVVCGPLSMGVCKVSAEIREAITLPATDTLP